jgi:hypothetical protein
VGYGLLVVPQYQWENEDGAGHASGSSGLLHMEVSWARVSQSSLKTVGGTAQMVHMAASWRSRGDEAMLWAASDSSTPTLPFSLYQAVRAV